MQEQNLQTLHDQPNGSPLTATFPRSLSIRYTPDDLANAARLCNWLNIFSRKVFFIFSIVAILGTVAVAAMTSASWLLIVSIIPAYLVLAYLVVLAIHFVYVPWYARSAFKQQKTLHVQADLSWSENGFAISTEDANSLIPWNKYLKWAENDRTILLFLAPTLYHVIPKRALSSPGEIDDFRQILMSSELPSAKLFA